MILQMSMSSNAVTHGHELAKAEETKDPAPGGFMRWPPGFSDIAGGHLGRISPKP